MAKVQVLVTLTAEAVVDVPDDVVDIEAFCRDRVSLAWGDVHVAQLVQAPSIAVEHYHLPEPQPIESEPEAAAEAEGPLVDAARAIGSTLGKVASAIENLTGPQHGEAAVEEPSAEAEPVVAPEPALQAQDHVEPPPWQATPVAFATVEAESAALDEPVDVAAAAQAEAAPAEPPPTPEPVAAAPPAAEPFYSREELLALFSDSIYRDMIRSAVQERAVVVIEAIVAEVVGELEPLLRRHLEKQRSA